MSYPMTYKRLINRNQLSTGDYAHLPDQWGLGLSTLPDAANMTPAVRDALVQHRRERLEALGNKIQMFLGDLRRLEHDTVDENATCLHIASRTGIDPDTVAAVLKEFMDW